MSHSPADNEPLFDRLYRQFEDSLRGSEGRVRTMLREYVPVMGEAGPTAERPALDIGCGRGEWLSLMREQEWPALGLDMNASMVARARELGYEVEQAEARRWLRARPDGSYSAVTGFHIVEHMRFEEVLELLRECWRVVKPGGVVIFETPNPENLLVGASNFYKDPTHRRPLPPDLLRFGLESQGFERVEIRRLHPVRDLSGLDEALSPLERDLAGLVYGPQDYAGIGWRPAVESV